MSARLRILLPLVAAVVLTGAAWDSVNPGDLNQSLRDASTIGNLDKVQRLIARGADVNGKDEIGVTPLIMASMLGYSAVVKKILEAGVM
jgi:ankyrin repeat protein